MPSFRLESPITTDGKNDHPTFLNIKILENFFPPTIFSSFFQIDVEIIIAIHVEIIKVLTFAKITNKFINISGFVKLVCDE